MSFSRVFSRRFTVIAVAIFAVALIAWLFAYEPVTRNLVASEAVVRFIQSRASHAVIPSFHSQAVAIAAYRMGFDTAAAGIIGPTNESRAVVEGFLKDHEINHILGKGYYAFLDMGPWLESAGLADSGELGTILAERFGLAVVPGVYFSEFGANWIRVATHHPTIKNRKDPRKVRHGWISDRRNPASWTSLRNRLNSASNTCFPIWVKA